MIGFNQVLGLLEYENLLAVHYTVIVQIVKCYVFESSKLTVFMGTEEIF